MVTCGPGPRTGRPHGTRYRPQSGYKLRARAAGGRGQGAGSGPAGGPGPLPQSLLRYTGDPLPRPQHGPQTLPLAVPRRLGLGKDRKFREREQVTGGRDSHTGASQERDAGQRDGLRRAETDKKRQREDRQGQTEQENQTHTARRKEGERHINRKKEQREWNKNRQIFWNQTTVVGEQYCEGTECHLTVHLTVANFIT